MTEKHFYNTLTHVLILSLSHLLLLTQIYDCIILSFLLKNHYFIRTNIILFLIFLKLFIITLGYIITKEIESRLIIKIHLVSLNRKLQGMMENFRQTKEKVNSLSILMSIIKYLY